MSMQFKYLREDWKRKVEKLDEAERGEGRVDEWEMEADEETWEIGWWKRKEKKEISYDGGSYWIYQRIVQREVHCVLSIGQLGLSKKFDSQATSAWLRSAVCVLI